MGCPAPRQLINPSAVCRPIASLTRYKPIQTEQRRGESFKGWFKINLVVYVGAMR